MSSPAPPDERAPRRGDAAGAADQREPADGNAASASADLVPLGWDAAWQAARAAADPALAWQPARIAAEHRGAYQALGPGGVAWVELTGRSFHTAADKRDLPTVGDWVLVERWREAASASGAGVIRAVLPRRSFLVRRAAGEATAPQPLAANVDTGIVVTSANADLSPARLDRYLGLLRDGGIAPVLALSKVDLVPDPSPLLARLAALADRVVAVSVVTGAGLAELRALAAPGATCVLLGSSGVGKSSLLNAIAGTAQPTRAIRDDDRGRHTTTRRELFVAASGGLWIDTPGMRELGHWLATAATASAGSGASGARGGAATAAGTAPSAAGAAAAAAADHAFDDIAALAETCRFRDCRHTDEPGCAVRAAIPAPRLASFHKLAGERRAATARQAAVQKLTETRRTRAKKPPPSRDE